MGACVEKRRAVALVAVVGVALAGSTCGSGSSGPDPNAVASVTVTPPSGFVDVADSLQFAATTRNAQGQELSGKSIAWESLDTAAATVTSDGWVHGIWPGVTAVIAASEGMADTATITVRALLTSISLNPVFDTLDAVGQQASFTVTAYIGARPYAGGSFSWNLDTPGVASLVVNPNGRTAVATAIANGSVWVRVHEASGLTDSSQLVVAVVPSPRRR